MKNSNPTVALYESSKVFFTALFVKHDFPTLQSPITINLKLKSKLVWSSGNISNLYFSEDVESKGVVVGVVVVVVSDSEILLI